MAGSRAAVRDALRSRRQHLLPLLAAGYVLGVAGLLALDPWPVVVKALFVAALPALAYVVAAAVVALAPDRVPTPSRSRAATTAALAGVTAVGLVVALADVSSIAVVMIPTAAVLAWPLVGGTYLGIWFGWSGASPLIVVASFALGAAGTAVWQYWLVGWVSRRVAAIRAGR
ncbi:hypothetical protein DVK05_12065 [Halorubrum sp. Atlit-8R]|uniref:hypothetical protein n=1 Tax=unclassified Halorubrum TaxID=2642239 RepID=UPI000EF1CFD6|nr:MULTISPECIES: hypothetical protein [unclassified Halorubrum]RLM67454.1 hypothetical protein DVK08_12135 [Halorubrum sp. Atlit-9R]RLM77614.1 hypothetical protein DVK05_12065 [Halorubrum sp. Atlit-8R]